MSLLSQIRDYLFLSPLPPVTEKRDIWPFVNMGGNTYPLNVLNQTLPGSKQEEPDGGYESMARLYKASPIVFAVCDARMRLFTEARFQFRRMSQGKPGDLFGTDALGILEEPWPNGNTSDLLARALQDADLAGNSYFVRRAGNVLQRLRPDRVAIILDRPEGDIDARVQGYAYYPKGRHGGVDPIILLAEQVAHFAPIPDPTARYRGMTWLTPVIREVMADTAAVTHKQSFFEAGATPNLVIKRSDEISKDAFKEWVALMEAGHAGAANAYKTLYLSSGADATVVGANLRQLDFSQVQGHGETRVAAAAGVPPIIVGLSEGLAAATYSNYGQARRAFADLWARPMWRNFAGSIKAIVDVPPGATLWYDDANIPFLAEDKADEANIASTAASTINALITTGFEPDAAVRAVMSNDLSMLVGQHSGLYSVQLQAPGTEEPEPITEPDDTPEEEEPA